MKTFKLYTLGCKVNQYETQEIRESLLHAGFLENNNGNQADICLINSCTVTNRADADSLQFIRRASKENPRAKIIITGCLTELDSDRIREIPGEKLIIRNRHKADIVNYIVEQGGLKKGQGSRGKGQGISFFEKHTRAFLKIQDGCNNFCAYCKVPLVRGSSRSKPKIEVLEEAERLVKNGFQEIVLTGICLGAYGRDLKAKSDLAELLKELEKIAGLKRIRLSSIEAGDVSSQLIEFIASSKKICRHLHIPIQSGDDEILKKMRRKYSHLDYARLIAKIKARIPAIAITTDCIVGFPGETRENFFNTVKLVRKIQPLKTHIFPYSVRQGTSAARLKSELKPDEIRQRVHLLKQRADTCALKYKSKFLGKKMEVLFESPEKAMPGFWQGHTDNYLKVLLKSDDNLKNKIIKVKLEKIIKDSIIANISRK